MAASRFFPDNGRQDDPESANRRIALRRIGKDRREYYERKVDALISTLLGLMEPIMIISVGSVVLSGDSGDVSADFFDVGERIKIIRHENRSAMKVALYQGGTGGRFRRSSRISFRRWYHDA
jgi:hypothetical protein